MHALLPLVFGGSGAGRRTLRALYPLISEDAPTTQIHVAMEGAWEGHPSGPFSLSADDFAQIVANFERSPNPIPLDYEHATEWADKAPACGWVHELEVRADDAGKAHLWATVELSDEAAGFIKAGAYRFSSGVFVFESVDHISGESIGTELTSLALTNIPYLRGQTPIQLSRRAPRANDKRTLMQKLTKEALLAALDQFEGDEIDMEQLEAAAHLAAVKDGGSEPEAPEAPAADMPDEEEEPAALASDDEDDEQVEASDVPAAGAQDVPLAEDAPAEPSAEGDAALAAIAPLMEDTGMDAASLAAALMEKRAEIASLLAGGESAGAPMSDREAELALSARDNTIRVLAKERDELATYKANVEKEAAKQWALSLRDDGRILDADVDEWASLRLSDARKAEKLAPKARVVPLGAHASAVEPPTEGEDATAIDESSQLVKDLRQSFAVLGGKWATKAVQDKAIRKALALNKTPAQARA